MKKALALLLTLCMLCSMCTMASAATITSNDNQSTNTTVLYGVDVSYMVTIPDSIAIDSETKTATAELSIRDAVLPANAVMTIRIDSENAVDGKWYLRHPYANDAIEYTISSSLMGKVLPGDVFWVETWVLELSDYTETCTFTTNGIGKYADVYVDTLTYAIGIVPIVQPPVCYACGGEFTWSCDTCESFETCTHVCAKCPTCSACFNSDTNTSWNTCYHCEHCDICIMIYDVHMWCTECQKCFNPPDYCDDCKLCVWCDKQH